MINYGKITIVGTVAILLLIVVFRGDSILSGLGICPGGEGDNSVCALGAASKQPTNRLGSEKSPYLLQHAGNPVDWYPWGDEAFARAKREDKPIFVSIGYSTCHWCHVMEHESFEDSAVAALMNEAFVSIKVDREERPDIDNIYMGVCQMMTGSGGWPLTIIMTPEKKPFFAGTYIPKNNAYGRLGMMELIPRVVDTWTNRRQEVLSSAESIADTLRQQGVSAPGVMPDLTTIAAAVGNLKSRYDARHGGFGRAPKFPSPHNLTLLLRHWKRNGDPATLAIVETTLRGMRRGGVYDQIGYGFHRYSTDPEWLVPHFEKMLYDQALLVMAYVETYQATGDREYARTAEEIMTYVLRDMTSPEGAFWSAEDADSEGEEGKFYLWSESEIRRTLPREDAELFIRVFNIRADGNYVEQGARERSGLNIPHLTKSLSKIADDEKLTLAQLDARLERIRSTLFTVREARIHPHKDDKVLADWCGLMIAASAKASQALDRPDYAEAAARAAEFVLTKMRLSDGRLVHRYRDEDASLTAHVDDYAFMVWGLIELYEATFDAKYLAEALSLNRGMLAHFWDNEHGGFFFTADDAEELLVRQKETYDGAIPSGNSVAMLNLVRLSRYTGDMDLQMRAEALGKAFSGNVWGSPPSHTQMLQAVDFLVGPSSEIVICGKRDAEDTKAMLRAIRGVYEPNKVILFKDADDDSDALSAISPYTRALSAGSGRARAYVCRGFTCQLPTTESAVMLAQLQSK